MHQIITINMYFCLFLNTLVDALRFLWGELFRDWGGCEQFLSGPRSPERQSLLPHGGKCTASRPPIRTGRRLCREPEPPSVSSGLLA